MRCPVCKQLMRKIKDTIKEDGVEFEAFKCSHCGEQLMNVKQLRQLAEKYRDLRRAKTIRFAKWGNSIAVRIPTDLPLN